MYTVDHTIWTPITSNPRFFSKYAETALSTPPEIAHTTFRICFIATNFIIKRSFEETSLKKIKNNDTNTKYTQNKNKESNEIHFSTQQTILIGRSRLFTIDHTQPN